MYKVKLKIFEGPLDLLLFLIKKNELDIYDIPIVKITEQYLEYIELMKNLNLEIVGEFLVMASTLMLIKSKMLLPCEEIQKELEEIDPREELVLQLLEYQKYKKLAEDLREIELNREDIFKRTEGFSYEEEVYDVSLFDLLSALRKLLETKPLEILEIIGEEIPVEQKMKELFALFKNWQIISFNELFENCKTKLEIIVTFLALLELVKTKNLKIYQIKPFGEIKIYKILLPMVI